MNLETSPFDVYLEELNTDNKIMKKGKVAGVDDIRVNKKHETRARELLLNMNNECINQMQIPKM